MKIFLQDQPDLSKCEDFDQILEVVGPQGKFQKVLLYLILCPIFAIQVRLGQAD
jgi:hypothetical protein